MVLFADIALLPDGFAANVRLEISESGTFERVLAGCVAAPGDMPVRVVLPGLPNVHSHAFQRAMAGRAERGTETGDDFWSWRETMYELAATLDPESLYRIARDAYSTMLAAGYTSVAEFHYVHRDAHGRWYGDRAVMAKALVTAARDAGLAIVLLPALYAHGDMGAALDERRKRFATGSEEILAIAQSLRAEYLSDAHLTTGVCAHSLRAVTPSELRTLVEGSPDDVPIHLHVAEQLLEVRTAERVLGARPVAWLLDNFDVDERWCLVHATHIDAAERSSLAKSGAVAGLCPTTEANLGDGLFPLGDYLNDGGTFGIGSDSNVSIDVAEELRWLEYGQRLVTGRRMVAARSTNASCGETLYRAAALGGARALGRRTGMLATGYRADLVVLETNTESFLLDRYIFAATPLRPQRVMVSGRFKN